MPVVVIIEDDAAIRVALERVLARRGHTVHAAATALGGLETHTRRGRPKPTPAGPQDRDKFGGRDGRLSGVSPDCVFCRIVAGTAPASLVYADDRTVAFLDIAPITPGHLLVVPRAHTAGLADLDPDTGGHVFRVAQRLAAALRRSGLRCDGVNLFLADGAAAFQEVFHLHLHVLPRWRGDGLKLGYKAGKPSRADLERQAADIRVGLDRLALPD